MHTSVGGSFISGLVSKATNFINNITSSLFIVHTGSYLDRCSHIASNAIGDESGKTIQISNITLTGSMSITGTSDIGNNYLSMRNFGGIIARATLCDIRLTGIAINGYQASHSQTLRGCALVIGEIIESTVVASDIIIIPFSDIVGFANLNIDGVSPTPVDCSDHMSKTLLQQSLRV